MPYKTSEIRQVLRQEQSRGRRYLAVDPDIAAANRNREKIAQAVLRRTETEKECREQFLKTMSDCGLQVG